MNVLISLFVFSAAAILAQPTRANVHSSLLTNKTEILKERTLSKTLDGSLSATEFSFTEMKKKITVRVGTQSEVNFTTDIRAAYRVGAIPEIENYAIVQWIRGCQFESIQELNGSVSKHLSVYRNHFGQLVPFKHSTWEIDSDSDDPVYSSYATQDKNYGRHALLRWNKNPESLDPETAQYYADQKPEVQRVFITDMPGTAFADQRVILENGVKVALPMAKNVSLEFETCLFKIADLPRKTDKKGLNIDRNKAIACFNWDHKFIYNFQSRKFSSVGPIDSFCSNPN